MHSSVMFAQSPRDNGEESEEIRAVRVYHAEIKGRVFIVSEEEGEEEYPGEDVRVRVLDEETDDVILQTRTDKEGYYDFPRIDVGTYILNIGRLRLNMEVLPDEAPEGQLPKIIIVMIPKELAEQ